MKIFGLFLLITISCCCHITGQQVKSDSFLKAYPTRILSHPTTESKNQIQQQLLLSRQQQIELTKQAQEKILFEKQKKELADKETQLLKLRFQNKQKELQLTRKAQAEILQKNQFEARINAAKKDKEIITQQNQISYNKKWNLFLIILFLIVAGFAAIAYYSQRRTKRLNAVIFKQHAELEQMGMVKDTILGVVSHDMRSPVNTLLAFTDLIKEGDITQDKLEVYLDQINLTLNHTSSLMNNLLSWAASQMQGFKTVIQPVDASLIAAGTIHFFSNRIAAKKILVTNKIEPGTFVMADANMLELIIRNLVSNALKYTEANGVIYFTAVAKENNMIIAVADTGVGMAEKKRNLFNSITMLQAESTAGTAKEKGTGLGLLLCKTFTRLLQGKITVQPNSEGQGCRFELVLPRG